MIGSVLSKRRSIPVIVRRADAELAVRSQPRGRGRRARPRALRVPPTRSGLIAVAVLVAAAIAWIATFAYLASLA